MKGEYGRKLSPKLLKDTQEAKKHIPQQGHLLRTTSATQVAALLSLITVICQKQPNHFL